MKQIKRAIRLCAALLAAAMFIPMLYGAYSLLRYGTRWRTSEYNTYLRDMKSGVVAGTVYDRFGAAMAYTDPASGERRYAADEDTRLAVAHAVGDSRGTVKNAAETFLAEYLYGARMTYLERLRQSLSGELRGDDVYLTLDSALCAYIRRVFPQDKSGAAVVMNYRTGEVYAMVSFPSFDPAEEGYAGVTRALNRATRWLSAPGSTFKIVTLSAALQNIAGAEEATYECTGGITFSGQTRGVRDYGGDAHGQLSLRRAFAVSCNSTFAQLALRMGDAALRRTAEDFGVGDDFTFRDLVVENSAYALTDGELTGVDLAWTGAGQNELGISPLHMCMIAAAVANDGVMMEPRLLLRAVTPEGKTRAAFAPVVYRRALPAETAATVRAYMREVAASGTGRAARVPGYTVCAKTGTAEIDTQENDNAWFVGFLEDESLPVAVCVAVADSGTGGSVAAPVAQKIFSYFTGK